ncbi:hypothetical protein N476_19290 [Pseudoalteromonas luteoviolacea H33]|uniref:Uncharacterized protein n=1 Tax=Pseudoalteromonas luteoviolacea H33 TaxID=1365251 RepID=A0A162AGP5_9GAMM|nr:hypothetical protein N476_19290 [Pseudoalteromonas luteoviolacea H33]KZN72635.1 hypothetical protein N477_24890 [Pseudoalteromonas luteoviolacea H33-S]
MKAAVDILTVVKLITLIKMDPDLHQDDEGEIAAEPNTFAKWVLTFVRMTNARLQLNLIPLQNGS